jgi:hypothetical protein
MAIPSAMRADRAGAEKRRRVLQQWDLRAAAARRHEAGRLASCSVGRSDVGHASHQCLLGTLRASAMDSDFDLLYRRQLTSSDIRLIAGAVGTLAPDDASSAATRGSPDLGFVLGHPELEAAVFGGRSGNDRLIAASPFLTFAIAVHRTADRLRSASFVEERAPSGQRLPVFDVESLRELLAEPQRRYFLVELLESYTHVVSGATWHRTRRGWRRRRFSELDLSGLADLPNTVEPSERPRVYRRIGDLVLFLTGVFPDHPVLLDVGPVALSRLARLSGLHGTPDQGLNGLELLEALGGRFYGLAVRSTRSLSAPSTAGLTAVDQIARRFSDARRVLNVVTDWYLFPLRGRWFGLDG